MFCESWPSPLGHRAIWCRSVMGKVNTLPLIGDGDATGHHYDDYCQPFPKQNATGRQPPNVAGPIIHNSAQPILRSTIGCTHHVEKLSMDHASNANASQGCRAGSGNKLRYKTIKP